MILCLFLPLPLSPTYILSFSQNETKKIKHIWNGDTKNIPVELILINNLKVAEV